jgi:hypothetical protein
MHNKMYDRLREKLLNVRVCIIIGINDRPTSNTFSGLDFIIRYNLLKIWI